ncbi:MAG: DUF11 domain-containing protein, partial [Thermodesulfobacteriota bacterium]|nr:DUF11 domain-containing protein [Thermodesulfobacteriota bacterium]
MRKVTSRAVLLICTLAILGLGTGLAQQARAQYEAEQWVHVVADHHATPNVINAYSILEDGVSLKYEHSLTVPEQGIGAGGLARWHDPNGDGNYSDGLVLVTFEVLEDITPATIEMFYAVDGAYYDSVPIQAGEDEAQDLAGIVVDQDTGLIYVVDRFTNDLYILRLDVVYNRAGAVSSVQLLPENIWKVDLVGNAAHPFGGIVGDRSPIYFQNKGAVGLALGTPPDDHPDKTHEGEKWLFVTDMTNMVRYYDVTQNLDGAWEMAGWMDMTHITGRPNWEIMAAKNAKGVSVAYDEEHKVIYTGGGYRFDYYLRKYDLNEDSADFYHLYGLKPGMGAIGVVVNPRTDRLYMTTGYEGDDVRSVPYPDLKPDYRYPDDEAPGEFKILNPAGICIGPAAGASPPALTIEKTDDPDPVIAGNELTYPISVSNTGGSTVHNVILTDVYPPETTYVSGGDSHNASTRTVTWNAFDLAAGASMDFELTVEVIPTTADTTITNTATVDSDETGPVSDDEDTEVNSRPSLTIEKTDDPDPVIAGNELTYTMSVSNVGGSTAHSVILTDTYPPETTYVSGGDSHNAGTRTVTWNAFDLAGGASTDFTLTVEVIPTTADTTITNTATVDSDETGPVSDDEDTEVNSRPSLAIEKTDDPDPVIAGNELTYPISVSNTGGSTVHNVILTDVYPVETTYVSGGDSHNASTRTVTWNAFDLAAGASMDFELTV